MFQEDEAVVRKIVKEEIALAAAALLAAAKVPVAKVPQVVVTVKPAPKKVLKKR